MRWTAPVELFLKVSVALWLWNIIRRPRAGRKHSERFAPADYVR